MLGMVLVWVVAIAVYIPHMITLKLQGTQCRDQWLSKVHKQVYAVVLFVAEYLIPVVILGCCYCGVIKFLKQEEQQLGELASNSAVGQRRKEERRSVRIITAIVIGFAVLTLPNAILFLYVDFAKDINSNIQESLQLFGVLMLLHTAYDPLVYSYLDKKFRHQLKDMWCGRCKEHANPNAERTISHTVASSSRAQSSSCTKYSPVMQQMTPRNTLNNNPDEAFVGHQEHHC